MTQKLPWKDSRAIHSFFGLLGDKFRWCSLLLLASWYFRISAVFGLCEPGDVLWKPGVAHLGAWWCWQNADKTCASWRRELFACRFFSSPFCILPGIGHLRKRPGLNHSTTWQWFVTGFPPLGFPAMHGCMISWELGKYRRTRRWCILGWRQVSERLMSDRVTEWLNGNAMPRVLVLPLPRGHTPCWQFMAPWPKPQI